MRGDGRIFRRKRSPFWWCAYYLRGREIRESTLEVDPKRAEKYLKQRMRHVGADQIGAQKFVTPRQEKVRVWELLDALEADYKLRNIDSAAFRSHLKSARAYFGEWTAVGLTAEAIDEYISDRLEEGVKPATINRRTQLIRQAYALAIERRRLSQAPHVRKLSEEGNTRKGFFEEGQFRNVHSYLPEYLQDYCLFSFLVGWRKGEISVIAWEDVEDGIVRLAGEDSKNGKPRMIPIVGELVQVMERRKAARAVTTAAGEVMLADLVFHRQGRPIGDTRKAWQTACVAAGVGKFVCRQCKQPTKQGHKCESCGTDDARYVGKLVHDLRRTAVRNMVRAGVHEKKAMSISGHKTRSMFDRYNIVSEDDQRDALMRTEAYRKSQTKKQPTVITNAAKKLVEA